MERTFFNFSEKLRKPLHILTAFAVIICTAFTVPSFAYSSEFPVFSSVVASRRPSFSDLAEGSYYFVQNNSIKLCAIGSSVYDVYAFAILNSSDNRYYTYGFTESSSGRLSHIGSNGSGGSLYTLQQYLDTDIYYNTFDYSASSVDYLNGLPVFDTLEDAYDSFINGGSDTSVSWVNKPLTIPQGYAAVINTSNMTAGHGSFRLRANTGNLGNSNLWRDVFGNDNIQSGQAIYNTNTAISSYDFDDYPQLTWSPYEYSLVRATAYEYIGEATTSNTYTYIFNPIQSNATSIKTGQNTNSYITLYMNEQFDGTVKLYPLTSMAALGQGQTIEVGNDQSDNSGSGDISNGTWTNSDGNVYTPPQGGGNGTGSSQNPLESLSGTVEHLGEVLNQFVGGLSTILTAPVEAIQTLINNGSAFVSQLSGLYSWLPSQVYSTLTSAIVLCITVGVLKVLL